MSKFTRPRRSEIAAIALVGVLAITGCAGSNPVEDALDGADTSAVEKAVEDAVKAQGEDIDIDLNNDGTMPEGFPADVPVIDGKIDDSSGLVNDDGAAWIVVFEVEDSGSAFESALAKLEDAGFTANGEIDGDDLRMHSFEKSDLQVVVSEYPEDSSVGYSVTQAKAG